MRTITLLGLLALALVFTTVTVSTSASACPSKYVRCGAACCPR